jgi:hypothetical protein
MHANIHHTHTRQVRKFLYKLVKEGRVLLASKKLTWVRRNESRQWMKGAGSMRTMLAQQQRGMARHSESGEFNDDDTFARKSPDVKDPKDKGESHGRGNGHMDRAIKHASDMHNGRTNGETGVNGVPPQSSASALIKHKHAHDHDAQLQNEDSIVATNVDVGNSSVTADVRAP